MSVRHLRLLRAALSPKACFQPCQGKSEADLIYDNLLSLAGWQSSSLHLLLLRCVVFPLFRWEHELVSLNECDIRTAASNSGVVPHKQKAVLSGGLRACLLCLFILGVKPFHFWDSPSRITDSVHLSELSSCLGISLLGLDLVIAFGQTEAHPIS